MKFRAKINDVGCLNHFTRVVNTVTKLTKACVVRFTVDNIYFVLSGKVANGGVSMWCELLQVNFFDEYQLEGVSEDANEICLEINPENLSRALKTAQNAKSVKIKLTKKHCPCLTLAAELPSLSSISRIVTHDIPVDVIPRRLWHDFKEPSMPDFDVSKIMHFALLKGASQSQSQSRDVEAMAHARVDIRKLQQFLNGQQVNPTKSMCNIVDKRIIHLILLQEDVSLQYFIPAVV
ncbi:Checkpoint protein HUS1 [Bagarius yarrelli]|uniref:Checkpoint protein n=1 Tax=Bagarius yarrelli TaxID=175774 RepID=A0A556TM52_BAGYA|nr:Checkpoint protein HUS1 [Bagarius yarrelli]